MIQSDLRSRLTNFKQYCSPRLLVPKMRELAEDLRCPIQLDSATPGRLKKKMMCEELKDHLIFISMHSDIDRPELLRRLSLQLLGARFDIVVQQSPSEAKDVSHHLVAREKR